MMAKEKKVAVWLLAGIGLVLSLCAATPAVDYARLADGAFKGTVKKAETRDRQLGVIELFRAAYYFCRSGQHLDALDTLFDVATEMQDRREGSRGCGNFRWYWRDGFVMDYNAVDFCMEQGSLIARSHRDKLTPSQRKKFESLLDWSIRGCLAHRVRDGYTNIAIMNAVNLILLGEACGRTDVFDEGVKRLDAFLLNTALYGVCEYSSPTYTGVDLNNLHRLHGNVEDPAVKAKAEKLLRLFWTDVAASSFVGAGRLGGTHSRDYDYLYGRGSVAGYLQAAGLVPVPAGGNPPLPVDYAEDDWRIDAPIRALARQTPRRVESFWGEDETKYRVYWAGRHVALGISGENYWNMDIPLAVDFVSTNNLVRGYFIADGRRDPYGLNKIPEGNGPHQKTLHLRPFWGGVQRGRDALGLVVYRPQDIPVDYPTLESHFVFPSEVDEICIGETPVELTPGKPFARELPPGSSLFVRKGGGALAVRIPWAQGVGGRPAKMALVWDARPGVPACRLTVAHHDYWGAAADDGAKPRPGAAFWVRVCDEAAEAQNYSAFRAAFAAAAARVAETDALRIDVAGEEGPLMLEAASPFDSPMRFEPAPKFAVFSLDGRDVGADILGAVPGVAEFRAEMKRMRQSMEKNRIYLNGTRDAVWEAESGVVVPKMQLDKDPQAHGGAYVWAPGEPGGHGGGPGSVSWQIDVGKAGVYYLWGRVNAPTPDDDSFFVTVSSGEYAVKGLKGTKILPQTDWPTGVTRGAWKWCPFKTELNLPKGPCVLSLGVRENGTKIDRLLLTVDEEPSIR